MVVYIPPQGLATVSALQEEGIFIWLLPTISALRTNAVFELKRYVIYGFEGKEVF